MKTKFIQWDFLNSLNFVAVVFFLLKPMKLLRTMCCYTSGLCSFPGQDRSIGQCVCLTLPRCKIGTSLVWEDRSGASPVWDVEQPLILTLRLGEFSGVVLALCGM